MKYIVIEDFNETINIVHKDGEPFVTDDLEEAEDMLNQTQGGYVLPLCDIVGLAKIIYNNSEDVDMQMVRFEMKVLLNKF